jgi:Kef-type K+ transport system membrane component KefB
VGYIATGIIVGPYLLNLIGSNEIIEIFSKLGIALLLFMVGLHLNPRVIKDVGFVSLVTGVGQVVFTTLIGFFAAKLMGFSTVTSLYVAIALTFSSTIIIMKLLSDKGDLDTLYGKISIGFLIVQDLLAIFALMLVSSFSGSSDFSGLVYGTLFKGLIALGFILVFSFLFLGKITTYVAKSQEFLLLFSVGWCFALASLFQFLNFSIEIGALLAGVTLSLSPYNQEISSKMKPLRDFFIVLFFIYLGSQMVLGDVTNNWFPIAVFSLIVLVGNPLIVMILMGTMKHTKRNGFLAGLTVAQIGEFSLIWIILGQNLGYIPSETISIVTMVSLMTIAGSTYLVIYSEKIYPWISGYLKIFERKNVKEKKDTQKKYSAILFGYNRIGFGILRSFKKIRKKYLVVDFNPDVISTLIKYRIPCEYGDAYDIEFLDDLPLAKTELIVSTIPDAETNILLLEEIRKVNKNAVVIIRSNNIEDALEFYKKGADYVLTPHFLGGEYVSKMIEKFGNDSKDYKKEKERHLDLLKEMTKKGKNHPDTPRG